LASRVNPAEVRAQLDAIKAAGNPEGYSQALLNRMGNVAGGTYTEEALRSAAQGARSYGAIPGGIAGLIGGVMVGDPVSQAVGTAAGAGAGYGFGKVLDTAADLFARRQANKMLGLSAEETGQALPTIAPTRADIIKAIIARGAGGIAGTQGP
jgi:hypothetical protein